MSNPLLSPPFYIIPGIDPNSPISAQTEQIDQLNTLLLQDIDANFAKFHQIVTSRILPEIKRFAIAGEPTREAAQFWRSFFEAASSIKAPITNDNSSLGLGVQHDQDTSTQYDDQTMTLRRDQDDSRLSTNNNQNENDESGSSFIFDPPATSSTPLPFNRTIGGRQQQQYQVNSSWEDSMESPFDKLDRKLRDDLKINDNIAGTITRNNNYENSGFLSSSNEFPTPSLPSGYSLPNLSKITASSSSSSSKMIPSWNQNQIQDQSQESEQEEYSTGTVNPNDLPTSNLPRPSSATPKPIKSGLKSSTSSRNNIVNNNPFGPNFNGIADLRNTPLNPGKKVKKQPKQSILPGINDFDSSDEEDNLALGMSPPVTMKFSLPPKAKAIFDLSKTPNKKVIPRDSVYGGSLNTTDNGEKQAKFILDDLLEEMNSELSPRLDTPEGLGRYSILPGELQPGEGRLLFSDSRNNNDRQQSQRPPVLEEEIGSDETYHHQSNIPSTSEGNQQQRPNVNRRSTGANTSFGSDIVDVPIGRQIYSTEDSFDQDDDSFDDDISLQPSQTGTNNTGTVISSLPYSINDHQEQQHYINNDISYMSSEGDLTTRQNPYGDDDDDRTTMSEAGAIFGKQPTNIPQLQQQQQQFQKQGLDPRRKSHFELMKMDEMDTYHGGRLEDAAGDDVFHSPTNQLRKGGNVSNSNSHGGNGGYQ
ncbi:uncharacterized protein L201_006312 [Kwoniella dendrophila CBS 6074]|uniref:DASH complex subunit ASK1 n=1 Tax=Kwoniella dendrophila CBS 6074 TaxID=1295534 RepID=A0AAX4K2G0_9TREE